MLLKEDENITKEKTLTLKGLTNFTLFHILFNSASTKLSLWFLKHAQHDFAWECLFLIILLKNNVNIMKNHSLKYYLLKDIFTQNLILFSTFLTLLSFLNNCVIIWYCVIFLCIYFLFFLTTNLSVLLNVTDDIATSVV